MLILMLVTNLLYVPNRVIVKFKDQYKNVLTEKTHQIWVGNVLYNFIEPSDLPIYDRIRKFGKIKSARKLLLGNLGFKNNSSDIHLIYIIDFSEDVDVYKVVDELIKDNSIEYAEPDYKYPVQASPNDPLFTDSYYSGQWYAFKIMCPDAWDISKGSDSLIFGPIDTGVDWQHPDIFGNLWVNPGEDLNHNGSVDWPADSNGVDDDGNGFVDDVFGWDFMSNDWNPSPTNEYEAHGTHVFGITSATTDNNLGIAGISWNSRGMAFRCGANGYVYTSAAANAIVYAADHMANVENFSWGSYSASSTVQNAVNYAFSSGVLMFGAAGNETTGIAIYPARYDHVIGVGATDLNDEKTFFSNYGPGVDLMAPGASILSTVPGGGYESWDGTSMASPVAAGVGGLLMAYKPQLSPAEAESILLWSADDIYPVNADSLVGKLGRGRVNAWRALAMVTYSNIQLDTFNIDDYVGNGDGRPESGEVVRFYPVVHNVVHWLDASDVTLTFVCTDSLITVNDSTIYISSISNGDTLNVSSDYFELSIQGETRFIYFYIRVSSIPSNVNGLIGPFRFLVGYPEVVVVDDDQGDTLEQWYMKTLDSLSVPYEVWNTSNSTLNFNDNNRKLLIWFTGNDSTEVLSQVELDSIVSFLNNGGSLFISSQYLAEVSALQTFMNSYLHASVDSTGLDDILAMKSYDTGNEFQNIFAKLSGLGSENNNISPDVILPIAGGDSLLYYTDVRGNANLGNAAVGYKGSDFSTIFFAFPFEAIDDNTPTRTNKVQVMADILAWFGITDIRERKDNELKITSERGIYTPFVLRENSLVVTFAAGRIPYSIEVYDIQGRNLYKKDIVNKAYGNKIKIPFAYSAGVYYIVLKGTALKPIKVIKIR